MALVKSSWSEYWKRERIYGGKNNWKEWPSLLSLFAAQTAILKKKPKKKNNVAKCLRNCQCYAHAQAHTFNGPFSGTIQVSRYQKVKINLDITEARDSEWQWHQLDHMQVCTSLQTDNHASTPPLSVLHAGCPSCRQTNSVKALKAHERHWQQIGRKV